MFEYILFDLDGTLTDPKEGICKSVQYALKKANIDEPNLDKLEPFIGPPLMDSFKMFYNMDDETASMAVVNFRERFESIGLYENEIYKGIDEMLIALKGKNIKLAVASSKPEVFVRKILKHFKIRKYFDVIVGSELDGKRSNKSEVVNEALRQIYGLPEDANVKEYLDNNKNIKNATVMVGDRKYDITGAKEFGLYSVGVKFGYASKGELEKAGANYIAPNVEKLTDHLLNGPVKKKNNNNLEDSKSSFSKAVNVIIPLIWYYFVMMLVTFVGLLITNSINRSGDFEKIMWISNNSVSISAAINVIALVLTAVVFILLFNKSDNIKEKLKYKNDLFIYLVAGGFLAIALNVLLTYFASVSNIDALQYEESNMMQQVSMLFGMLVFVVLSPLVEELLFRWLMYGRMKKMLNVRISVFVSALFFGFYHGNVLQGIYAFIMGMLMALIYEWTGSILASYGFHLGANAFVYILRFAPADLQNVIINIPSSIILLICGIAIIIWEYSRKNIWN